MKQPVKIIQSPEKWQKTQPVKTQHMCMRKIQFTTHEDIHCENYKIPTRENKILTREKSLKVQVKTLDCPFIALNEKK